jgi:hypothetical protein
VAGILAVDTGRVMGFAFCEIPGGPIDFGHQELAKAGSRPGQVGKALASFFNALLDAVEPDLILYPQPWLAAQFRFETSFALLGAAFLIDTISETRGVEYASVLELEAVKALTGRGKFPGTNWKERREAKKTATVEACRARGWDVATHDEADAIAALLLGEAKRFPIEAMRRPMVLKTPHGPLLNNPSMGLPGGSPTGARIS